MALQGTREWHDYRVRATLTAHLAQSFGIAARVQGLRRYYALLITRDGQAQLVRELDGTTVLAQADVNLAFYKPYAFELCVTGDHLTAAIDGAALFDVHDAGRLDGGGIALLVEEGRISSDRVCVSPAL